MNWFVYLNRPGCPRWQDQYAYLLVALAAPLHQRQGRRRLKLFAPPNRPLLPPHQPGKGRDCKLSTASMAGLLGVDGRTVRSALTALEECGLVEIAPERENDPGLRPVREQLDWFQARKEQPKKVSLYDGEADRPWEGMTEQEVSAWVSDPTVSEYVRLLRHIRFYGVTARRRWRRSARRPNSVRYSAGNGQAVARLYQQAEKEHQESAAGQVPRHELVPPAELQAGLVPGTGRETGSPGA